MAPVAAHPAAHQRRALHRAGRAALRVGVERARADAALQIAPVALALLVAAREVGRPAAPLVAAPTLHAERREALAAGAARLAVDLEALAAHAAHRAGGAAAAHHAVGVAHLLERGRQTVAGPTRRCHATRRVAAAHGGGHRAFAVAHIARRRAQAAAAALARRIAGPLFARGAVPAFDGLRALNRRRRTRRLRTAVGCGAREHTVAVQTALARMRAVVRLAAKSVAQNTFTMRCR